MKENMTSNEVSTRFGKLHRDVTKSIRRLIDECDVAATYFTRGSYKNSRGKVYDNYSMCINGFCLLTDTWSFSRGKSAIIKAEILTEFGETFSVVGSSRSRFEDEFKVMLNRFLSKDKITSQYPIGKYKADFFIPEYSIVIEYDEDQHFSKAALNAGSDRELAIRSFFKSELDDKVKIIRVKKGLEIEGLSKIMGAIAICSVSAIGCTKYDNEEY